ncbi:hypothetical protein H2199_001075 [Coniosporium tulheliwenetii]|uniref:Uncharacterized protein n=1 Tax=Coniosporium tulheliwenetii TaxID=3383036 RepID=A0ACC2ZL30_9PEZI|nr:hypothetical protein H2199_001075 [Cladosporium sp. JES 115]
MFTVPDSTPPSTPNSRRASTNLPSTTPAGPPPTVHTSASFTPAGPPPSSVFGSSELHSGIQSSRPNPPKAAFKPTSNLSDPSRSRLLHSDLFAPSANNLNRFAAPASSPPQPAVTDEEDEDDYEDEEMSEEYSQEDEDAMEEDEEDMDMDGPTSRTRLQSSAVAPLGRSDFRSSRPFDGLGSVRDARRGSLRQSTRRPGMSASRTRPIATSQKYDLLGLAKGLAASRRQASLSEPDDIVLRTEEIVNKLSDPELARDVLQLSDTVTKVAQQLRDLWHQEYKHSYGPGYSRIGPSEEENPLTKANFLASLLLQLHHPSSSQTPQDLSLSKSRFGRSSTFSSSERLSSDVPIPQVLLNWLNTYHDSTTSSLDEIKSQMDGYSAHPEFWEGISTALFRGRFAEAIKLLRGANFAVAHSAIEDGAEAPGYKGAQLENIQEMVNRLIAMLDSCPGFRYENWDIKGGDWTLFRHKLSQAIVDLEDFAEGDNRARGDDASVFGSSNFGVSAARSHGWTAASRRAESRVPWAVYQHLKDVYNLMLGVPDEIFASSYDWVEAAIGLTVWWDGEEEDEIPKGSLAISRRSLGRSQGARTVDVTPALAYRRKLASSLAEVFGGGEEELSLNTTDLVEVGLACVMDDNVEGAINILQCWSMTVTSALAEVASAAGWLTESRSNSKDIMKGFDKSDLLVLDYGRQDTGGINKDHLLKRYADALFGRQEFRSSDGKEVREGWELAVQVLARLDDPEDAKSSIRELLERLPLTSDELVDKVLTLCLGTGLSCHAEEIAERYADSIAETSDNYGTALLYYARAHKPQKFRNVLDLLTSLCLVQSMSYPPASDLDDRLKAFITSPEKTIVQLGRMDTEAASIIARYLSSYATIRRFYDLRDEELNLRPGQKPALRPIARKKAAAAALVAMITSANESIKGGLYDPSVDAVVQVDGLLTLLGEALPFVNRPKRVLDITQLYTLLRAVEDLESAPSSIYDQCEDCLQSALSHANGAEPPSPRAMLKKSISNLTASTQFSMVGSSMLASRENIAPSTEGSGVLVKGEVKRGWDWRKGLSRNAGGEDVLRVLRLGVAQEMARAWVEGEE